MKGNKEVIDALQKVLAAELVAVHQYFIHAELLENWGFEKLAAFVKKNSIDEMKHAEKAIERMLYLEGMPNLTPGLTINVGQSVEEIFKNDLALEIEAVAFYNQLIKLASDAGDNVSRDLLLTFLKDEEGHVDWLETQIELIRQVGLQNYLSANG